MRVALVSPYSWTYPGGVTRHIEALRPSWSSGHDVRVLAPFDPDRRRTAWLHRGARPQRATVPEWLMPLGPTIGWPLNGAVSNLARTPSAISTLRRELRAGGFDVVHLHEPVAPVMGWDALTSPTRRWSARSTAIRRRAPHKVAALLGARRKLNQLQRADRGLRGRGVDGAALLRRALPGHPQRRRGARRRCARPRARAPGEPLRIAFVGQAVERKGLPVLLRAFEALRGQVPAELTVIGLTQDELAPLLVEARGRDGARPGRRCASRQRCCVTRTCCARRRSAASRSGWS